jgi:replicative DNA helicase
MSKTDYIDRFLEGLDSPEKLDSVFDKLSKRRKLSDYAGAKDERTGIKLLSDYDSEAQELLENQGKVLGIKSGYASIDDLTKGFKAGDLTVLAGQPSHGKTVVGNNIAYRVAKNGTPVLFISLEMTQARIDSRIMDIAQRDNNNTEYKNYLFTQEASTLAAADTPLLLKKAIDEYGVQLIIIDHLHFLVDRGAKDIRMEVGMITQNLKNVAKEMKIPILLLCQVSRLTDPKQKPNNNNLKESGYIEQDADIILMVWRDISIDSENPNAVEVYCTKNRDHGFTDDRIKNFYQEGSALTEFGTPVIHTQAYVNPFKH